MVEQQTSTERSGCDIMSRNYSYQNYLVSLSKSIKRYQSFRHGQKPSRRSVKSNGNATGLVLKRSRVHSDTGLEQLFNVPQHQQRV